MREVLPGEEEEQRAAEEKGEPEDDALRREQGQRGADAPQKWRGRFTHRGSFPEPRRCDI